MLKQRNIYKDDDSWRDDARKFYESGLSIVKTYRKLSETHSVPFYKMRAFLQESKITRPAWRGFANRKYERMCVTCKQSFAARSPTTLMCDECAGDNRLKNYCQWRKYVAYGKKFGIEKSDFDELMQHQNGNCGLCGKELGSPCLDHCHSSGVIRGLLCNQCNLTLGVIENMGGKAWLQRATNWIDKAEAK